MCAIFFPLWSFDSIPGYHLPLSGFAITLIGHTALSRTPLDEWSARRTDLYLTTHNNPKRQNSLPLAEFEHTIAASERPQTHVLDRTESAIEISMNKK